MNCKNCGQEVSENDNFCLHCGQKIEKEITCQNCGHILSNVANFCPNCGTKISDNIISEKIEVAVTDVVTKQEKQPIEQTSNSLNLIKTNFAKYSIPALVLIALLSLFICSFFIGSYISVDGIKESQVGFSFLGETFDEIRNTVLALKVELSPTQLSYYESNLKVIAIVRAIVFILNIAITFIALSIALGKFTINYKKNKECSLGACAGISFASFLASCLLIKSFTYASFSSLLIDADVVVNNGMTTGSIIGLILSSIFIFTSIVIVQAKKKSSFLEIENIKKIILAILLLVFTIIISSNSFNFVNIGINDGTNSKVSSLLTMNFSATAFYQLSTYAILTMWGVSKQHTQAMDSIVINGQLGFIFYLVTLLFIALLIYCVTKTLLCDKKLGFKIIPFLAFTGISLIIQYIVSTLGVSSILEIFKLYEIKNITCSSNCIVLLVFGIISLIFSIFCWILSIKNDKSVSNQ